MDLLIPQFDGSSVLLGYCLAATAIGEMCTAKIFSALLEHNPRDPAFVAVSRSKSDLKSILYACTCVRSLHVVASLLSVAHGACFTPFLMHDSSLVLQRCPWLLLVSVPASWCPVGACLESDLLCGLELELLSYCVLASINPRMTWPSNSVDD